MFFCHIEYSILRPRRWSKGERHAHSVKLHFRSKAQTSRTFRGNVDIFQFARAQYSWNPRRDKDFPAPDDFPLHSTARAAANFSVELPPYSLCVVRGKL